MFYQKEIVILILGFATGATAWYIFWVKPHDAAREEIINCMDGNFSKPSYMKCLRESKP